MAVGIWAWLNGPEVMDIFSWTYWLFGMRHQVPFFSQAIINGIVSFFSESISYTAGLLLTIWCILESRRRYRWQISVSSVVMFLSIAWMITAIMKLALNSFYSWQVYQMDLLGCDLGFATFSSCNFVLLELPHITAALAKFMAVIFAAQIFSRRLDDTEGWMNDVGNRIEEKFGWLSE